MSSPATAEQRQQMWQRGEVVQAAKIAEVAASKNEKKRVFAVTEALEVPQSI